MTIHAFMVMEDNVGYIFQAGHVHDNIIAYEGMSLNFLHLIESEFSLFIQVRFGDANFPDIVNFACKS